MSSNFFLNAVYYNNNGEIIETRGINPRSDVFDKKESYTKIEDPADNVGSVTRPAHENLKDVANF